MRMIGLMSCRADAALLFRERCVSIGMVMAVANLLVKPAMRQLRPCQGHSEQEAEAESGERGAAQKSHAQV